MKLIQLVLIGFVCFGAGCYQRPKVVGTPVEENKAEGKSQSDIAPEPAKVVGIFYNVENLFDTKDDPKTLDNDFLPTSKKEYTDARYNEKLDRLTEVILAASLNEDLAFVGLCEVENKQVVEDLAARISMMTYGGVDLKVVHEESPDLRGIDNAFMYNPNFFKYEAHAAHAIDLKKIGVNETTRDILHVEGRINNQKVHFYINHWSSRRGGVEESNPKRMAAANTLKELLLTEASQNSIEDPRFIVMGDFNDETNNESVLSITGDLFQGQKIINLMRELDDAGVGTYNYRGNWNMLDQFLVSKSFLDGEVRLVEGSARPFNRDFLMYEDKKYGKRPSRSYGGPNYYGGYSDHLPITLEIYTEP